MAGFEAFDDEMAARHVLEMRDEKDVHDAAARRADDGQRLGGEFLGDQDAEAGGDAVDEADDGGRSDVHRAPCR